ncbi:PucR family transcriptional regulator [Conexibacter woesei]|uniref:Putative transcriptional regulator, PucR family n=1 Tax=Conexibacter woesei (strain DSM 14684 / CCUG 47730 / CIP 108061 / JCM 11494 / NBRC 100937 / ID131577) TaxID=469383 RepID=D3FEG8_CONWI|nr:helix-turn-helix domain-containing protein [Conexibacter woesei]ADB53660.1 putative transcriptional regulator, PucR family [Conexibacter woesei DSM 14684]
MTSKARGETSAPDLHALEAITEAIAAGAGLPEIIRAAARALDASLVLIDRTSVVLAVAARSPAEERALLRDAEGVERIELRVADTVVGQLRLRGRDAMPDPSMLRLVTTLIASEVERVRGPERASEEAAAAFVHAVLAREVSDRDDLVARGKELGISLERGGSVVVVRAHPRSATDDDWRSRLLALAERGARSIAPGAIAASARDGDGDEVVVLVADADGDAGRRVGATVLRELEANLSGFAFAVGRSRVARDPTDLHRAGNEALLAANVVEGAPDESLLAYDDTGTYQLLLPHMSDPAELRRFYDETVSKIVSYDEQYETSDLVGTLETFLECDGNVNATAARLITHRHTVRYRFERVREITGLDVASTDGREKLSFGLKAMRVLGIAAPRGPATERGAEAGRVRREQPDRSGR